MAFKWIKINLYLAQNYFINYEHILEILKDEYAYNFTLIVSRLAYRTKLIH